MQLLDCTLSLHVKPRLRSVLYLLLSLVGALFMTEAFEIVMAWWSGVETGAQALIHCGKAAVVCLAFAVLGMPLLKLIGRLTPKE